MKSKDLIEILNAEPDAQVMIQEQLNWPMCSIQSTSYGQGERGEKYVYLRTYDLDASLATAEAKDPVSLGDGIPLSEIHGTALRALDALGVALASHGHKWTPEERADYDKAVELLRPITPPPVDNEHVAEGCEQFAQ